jgi:uncharacterized protein YukE
MAFGGREIKSFLTLDITNFTQGLSGAKSKAASLQSELNGLQKGASGSSSEVSKLKQNSDGLNQTMNNLSQTTSKTGKELENTAKSTSNAGNNATTAQSKMHGLNNAMNLLKATAGILAITLGMDLAMQIMNVANSAVNAQGQIAGMARGMGWDSSQLTAYTNEMARLQTIYRKTDMNQVGMEVAKMARIYKLNASEAKDFIETSAVFSSAMAMEGRSARDSALALKDLIDQGQGWERRLSEIGVTADALKATGLWSGDKEDKKGIIAALNQVLEQRSLTQMAKEINSLDDAVQVLTIAGGQLLGAFLIPAAPLIYAITMALADLAYGAKNVIGWLSSSWAALPGWVQLGIIIGIASIALIGFGIILTSTIIPAASAATLNFINMLLPLFGLEVTAISTSGGFILLAGAIWSALAPLLPFIAAGIAAAVIIYKIGEYFHWWKDIPTMIEAIRSGVIRLWAAFTNNPHVVATINGIKEAWSGLLQFFSPLISYFQGLWNQLFPPTEGFDIVRAIIDLFGLLGDAVARVWGVLSPIGSALSWIGGLILNGAWQVLIGYWNTLVSVGQFLYSIFTSLTGAWDALVGAFFKDGEWQGIIPGLQNLGGMIWNAIVNIDWIGLGVFFWNSLMGIFSAGGDIIGQFMSWLVNVDWIGLFMAIGEWLIQFNPIGVLIGYIFGGDGGGGLLEAITLWASGIDWYGILMAMFQFIAQYNPLTMIVTLLFGDAAGQTFSTMLMNIFIFAAQGLMIGIQVIMGVIKILASFIGSTWSTIQSTTQWIWNNVFMTIWNIMNQIWGAVSPYVGMILSAWNQMKNGMLSAAVAIRDGVWGPIKTLYDHLKGFWDFITGGGSRGSGGGGGGFGGTTWPGAAGGPDISVLNYSGGLSNDGLFAGIAPMVFRSTQNRMYGAGPAPENDDTCYYDGNCYAGGWDFSDNWIDRALSEIYNWKMNLAGVSISLSTLKNGGSLAAFNALASAIIGRTAYQFYYGDQKSNAQALRDRRFNCYDGAQVIISLAQAMGLSASMAHGTWGSTGIPHVWAIVNGMNFDTTAFQNRGTWSPPPGSGAGGFGFMSSAKKVLQFVFNINGPVYDEDKLMNNIRTTVHEELNEVVDELYD